jgi:KDO2-lipid IV(A) lauroyltransferase
MRRIDSLTDCVLFYLAKSLSFLLRFLPISWCLGIARGLGSLVYLLSIKRRQIGYVNLKFAFGSAYSPCQRRRIIKKAYQNLAQNVLEMLALPKIDVNYAKRYIKIEGQEKIREALKKGNGIIFLSGHFGNWELSSIYSGLQGLPPKVLARRQKFRRLNGFLNRMRESKGCIVVTKGMATREIFKSLKENQAVGILADQDAGKKGVFIDFFHRPASTHNGAVRMALSTGAVILPAFIIREKGPYHRLVIEDPLNEGHKNEQIDTISVLKSFNSLLESYIRRYPSQWLWMHKRWKSTPVRSVLVLSDTKTGHIRQLEAMTKTMQKVAKAKRIELRIRMVTLRYRSLPAKALLALSTGFYSLLLTCKLALPGVCQGCLWCLRIALNRSDYRVLKEACADIILSCGYAVAPINFVLSQENMARSVVLMRPGILSTKRFNLVIMPEHDNPPERKNVIALQGALNLIDGDYLTQQAKGLLDQGFSFKKDSLKIGLLIGGDTKLYNLPEKMVREVIKQLRLIADDLDAEILATSSRRTPRRIELLLKEELGNFPRCKMLIIANEANIEAAVGGILGLSHIIIVSGESISMVSEAASCGKLVFVFEPQRKVRFKPKQGRFLEGLSRKNHIILISPGELSKSVSKVWGQGRQTEPLDENQELFKAIKDLI